MDRLSMTGARDALTALPEQLARSGDALAVTRAGKPVLAILPWDLYESIAETLEILADDDLMASLREGAREADEGRAIPWEEARASLER